MSSETTRTAARQSLLDLPAPWLNQLVAGLRPGPDLPPLLGVCTAMRDLILMHHHLRVAFTVPIPPDEAAAARAKLLLACKYSSRVRLACEYTWVGNQVAAVSSMRDLLATAAAEQELTGICSVTCRYMQQLDILVPPWLASVCPNMRRLTLEGCNSYGLQPEVPAVPVPCPQLQELELAYMRTPSDQPAILQWQAQLLALTNLTGLTLTVGVGMGVGLQLLQCCSVIGARLTRLKVSELAASVSLQQLGGFFPHIRDLSLPSLTVDDEGLEALLGMPQLRKFRCSGFQLQWSHAHRPCLWTHLFVTSTLYVASVDNLPLDGDVLLFTLDGPRYEIEVSQDLAVNARVAARLKQCGCNSVWHGEFGAPNLQLGSYSIDLDAACLEAFVPVLSNCKIVSLCLSHVRHVTRELLSAIQQHLSSSGLQWVDFSSCGFSPEALPFLLPCMPASVTSVNVQMCQMSEAQVTEMCVHACRAIEVKVDVFWVQTAQGWIRSMPEGWQGRVRAAMAAAGHQHAQL